MVSCSVAVSPTRAMQLLLLLLLLDGCTTNWMFLLILQLIAKGSRFDSFSWPCNGYNDLSEMIEIIQFATLANLFCSMYRVFYSTAAAVYHVHLQ